MTSIKTIKTIRDGKENEYGLAVLHALQIACFFMQVCNA